ncbi:MAG: hypothetical protein EOP06_05150, partial [Proteobacteria bacterium]
MNASKEVLKRAATLPVDQNGSRVEALGFFPLENLQHLDPENARRCQAILGHGDTFGIWETPESMVPYVGSVGQRRIDFRKRICAFLPAELEPSMALEALVEEGVLWLTCLGLLMRMGPAGIGKRSHQSLDATSVYRILHSKATLIVARGIVARLTSQTQPSHGFASALTPTDLRAFRTTRYMRDELRRLTKLQEIDLWPDSPPTITFKGKSTSPRGEAEERTPEPKRLSYQPIPDDYLAEMGPRVLWLIQDLGPNLIHLLETFPKRFENINFATNNSIKTQRCLTSYFEEHTWRDCKGVPILKPPFAIWHGSYRGSSRTAKTLDPFEWPIRNWASVANLAVTLQSAHLWVTLLMMAGRTGEIMTLPRNCIEWAQDGKAYVTG